jgi:hypothetical protein
LDLDVGVLVSPSGDGLGGHGDPFVLERLPNLEGRVQGVSALQPLPGPAPTTLTRANLDEEEHDLQPLATCLLTSEGCLLGRMSVGRARRQSRPRDRRCVIAVSQVQLGANCATAADERTIGPPAEGCL